MTVETRATPGAAYRPVSIDRGGLAVFSRTALHYSVAIIFLWFGLLKFTDYEASGIAPFIMNSPLIGWLHAAFGIAGAAKAIGVVEIVVGLLIAARPFSARAAAIGGGLGAITFLITLSFMLTTPGVIQPGEAAPFALSPMPGQFLLKDLVLLCACLWITGASLDTAQRRG